VEPRSGRIAVAVGLVAFVVYALTACPTFYWLDSSEFAAASATLGISHPPGHPSTLLLGRLIAFVPLGLLAFRVNLASSALGAAAVSATYLLAQTLQDALTDPATPGNRGVRIALSLAAAALFALSYGAWLQAVRAEVYALEAALLVASLALAVRAAVRSDGKALGAAGLLLGLGLGNHHLSTLLLLVPTLALAVALPALRRLPLARAITVGVLGAGILLYLPLRARLSPAVDWGHPDSWSRFLWVVSAKPFQKTALTRARFDLKGVADAVVLLVREAGWVAPAASLVGFWALLRTRARRSLGLYLGAALAFNVGAVLLTGFDPSNPDAFGYLLPSIAVLATTAATGLLAVGLTIAQYAPRLIRYRLPAAALAVVVAIGVQLPRGLGAATLRTTWGADTVARFGLEVVPPRATLLAGNFETVFNLWYLQAVEGQRPDVEVLSRGFALHPGYVETLQAGGARSAGLAEALRANDARLPATDLASAAARSTVLVEVVPGEDLEPAPAQALPLLLPDGPFFLVAPSPPPPDLHDAADRSQRNWASREDAALATDLDDPETRNALLLDRSTLAKLDCTLGRRASAQPPFDLALALFPHDEVLLTLGERCGLR
jgi:hypothetical protein